MDITEETEVCRIDWLRVLKAWMHDPVDKPLSIRDHQRRAKFYLSAALNGKQNVSGLESSSKFADITASQADRIPMPSAGMNGERAVNPIDGLLQIFHPVSAQSDEISVPNVSEEDVSNVIESIVCELPMDPRLRFLALWRLLPDNLYQKFGLNFTRLPADSRVPDHSLTQHVDITSGIAAANQFGHGYAILSVTLGPVQEFIRAARSVRDLWSGSALLSWLIFQGMRPILRDLGPTAMVFPALRGNSLTDLWLRSIPELEILVAKPSDQARLAPSLPNRFVALVPNGKDGKIASAFADACQTGINAAWQHLEDDIRNWLDPKFSALDSEWARHWDSQITSFFEVTTSTCPVNDLDESVMASLIDGKQNFGEVWTDAQKVRRLHEDIPLEQRPGYRQDKAGRWQAQLEISARMTEAQRSIRHVPQLAEVWPAGPKCSLLGTYEQMGPANLSESSEFWNAAREEIGNELRERERFCAVALCKRFVARRFLRYQLHLDNSDLQFPDTATIAAREWLQLTDINVSAVKNGRWLHQQKRHEDSESMPPQHLWKKIKGAKKSHGSPPSYYAILMIDADDMGLWLKGEKAPYVKEVLHPKLRKYFEQLEAEGLEANRPVGPALHGAISEALNNFASFSAPRIVKSHKGTLIYSGGDDVLALLPIHNAVRCAVALQKAFCGQNGSIEGWAKYRDKHVLAMGNKATLSGGIAFVHFKEDLRGALSAARDAEKESKDNGKNRMTMKFMRRSGERPSCDLPWELAGWFQSAIETFHQGISDRWVYQLRREEPVLSGLPEAVDAEITRLIERSEAMDDGRAPADAIPINQWWSHYKRHTVDGNHQLKHFIDLCLGASFLSRGFDG